MQFFASWTGLRWRLIVALIAAGLVLPTISAQAQWRGRGWHGGGWGWHGGWGWRGPGWGWRGPGWGWGGVSLGFVVPPFLFGWPYYPPAAYYPPPAYYPAPYGYYPNGYYPNAPSYYGYASPPVTYPAPQAYAQSGYPPPPALDPNNCGTPDEPKACGRGH